MKKENNSELKISLGIVAAGLIMIAIGAFMGKEDLVTMGTGLMGLGGAQYAIPRGIGKAKAKAIEAESTKPE